jgi:hypothetical protein
MEIPKSEFKVGANSMTFWGTSLYHVHDIGLRIYYSDAAPLLPGNGSDVTPPTGQLTTIIDDATTFAANAGGTLSVNNNKLTLKAENLSADTAYVEFHAWYEGYDEDNDRVFRDWHNRGRNNWWPGGMPGGGAGPGTGGVIDHVGTKAITGGATSAEIVWDIPHVTNQAKIKFKIRVVDTAGNVREAAGGESADFKMMRAAPVNAFILHDFTDFGLYMDNKRPSTVTYYLNLPASVTSTFTDSYLIGAYWNSPQFSINDNALTWPGNSLNWNLGIAKPSKSYLVAGSNKITYSWNPMWGFGAFVEEPGPMIVLRRGSAATDTVAPAVSQQNPAPNATNVSITSSVIAHVSDDIYGVDWTTFKLKINGEDVTAKTQLQGVMGNYRLAYKPQTSFAYGTVYNVEINACDMLGNCMPTAAYKFTTVPPDTTPPTFNNIIATPLSIGANISWTSNEPATSLVDYGQTTGYELGTVEVAGLKTSHLVQLQGLQSGKLYHYRIRGVDAQGNIGQSADATFTTLDFGGFVSDDFRICVLDSSLWQFVNPKNDVTPSLNTEQIEFTIPAGVSHDWSAGGPPRFTQTISNGDLEIEIKFDSVVTQIGQMQGLIIEQDANTYVRVVFERNALGEPIMRTDFVKNGAVEKFILYEFAKTPPTLADPPSYMKISRVADVWKMYWSTDGVTWTFAPVGKSFTMSVLRAGFFGGNSGAAGAQPEHQVVVDYIFNSAAKIVPEDGAPFDIDVTVVGVGAVSKSPDQSAYACDTTVQLNATAEPGWSFAGWSGDATGIAPEIDVVVQGPMDVTAIFTQDQYLLDVIIDNIDSGGAGNVVTKTPQKATYVYGDVVTLEAKPLPGWFFIGWSGDGLAGHENPLTLTMTGDVTITAAFSTNPPPELEAVADQVVKAGQLLTFQVKAADPQGDPVTLSYEALPPGATFADNGDGAGTFHWRPSIWQAGEHTIVFTASDGAVQSSMTVKITVTGMGIALPMIIGSD